MMEAYDEKVVAATVARALLSVKAIKLSQQKPFQWASGWLSPIYCDNRLTLSYPEVRNLILNYLVDRIKLDYPKVEVIAGVATAGIPQGMLVADRLGLPFTYVRSKPKGHGMENLIEGLPPVDQRVVVIEDLISTGGSSLKAVEALRAANANVIGMAAIFTYGFEVANKNFEQANVPLFTLSNYTELLHAAQLDNYIDAAAMPALQEWQKAPDQWGK